MTLSPDQNPDPLFPPHILAGPPDAEDPPWYAAHTKSRREKALAHYLRRAGIGYYLPMIKRRQSSGRRLRFSMAPVFPGYLFFRGNDADRHKALRSNHIARVIEVADAKTLLAELRQIEKVLSNKDGIQVYPFDFIQTGQSVRVKDGPLKGVEGRIVRKDRDYRLVLSVDMIMQSISISIDSASVEPLPL